MKISYCLVTTVILKQITPLLDYFACKDLYLYCKINKNIPQLHLFKRYFKNAFDVDKYNAILTMTYDKIVTEWLYYKKLMQI